MYLRLEVEQRLASAAGGRDQRTISEAGGRDQRTYCSMQMLTDWSRTRFLKVVFTSIIISSHVEICETAYLFVFRIRRIFICSTIV
jgi:hypothetical protein